MNPQDNTQSNMGNQPQGQAMPQQAVDGFGGVESSYANYNDQIVQQQQAQGMAQQNAGSVPINVVNANSNGVVSGEKMVSYAWERVAICLGVLAAGLLIGLVITLAIVVSKSTEAARLENEKQIVQSELSTVYGKMGATDLATAISRIEATETMNGGDLAEVNTLLTKKYGANYKLDLADSNINFIVRNGVYKVVSLGVYRESGTQRAVLYEKIADGVWKMGGYDASKADPCADSTEEEKLAIDKVVHCSEDNK